ncbi:TonB-dependent receptor plug domain-containing protein [Nostoc sp.]|uniref:TonB-dependent receptor plug domain-containing protein n=1 Tax=Nostoc sp. TaxID=1180 RepID=UPI002FF464BC
MLVKLLYSAICWLIPIFSVTIANPAYSEQPLSKKYEALSGEVNSDISSLTKLQSAKTSATYLLRTPRDKNQVSQLSQATTDVVSVTDVKVNTTDKGIELILVTANSVELSVSPKIEGNSYIANIPNAKLQLASGESFRSTKPVAGIALITVANLEQLNILRMIVTGETATPNVQLFDSQSEGLVFGVTSTGSTVQQPALTPEQKLPANDQKQPPIELEVTAPPDTGYKVPNTSVGTRTDTLIRDIPQSVQVIPRQLIEDQQALRPIDALRNVGVIQAGLPSRVRDVFTIRGFQTTNILRNGLPEPVSNLTNPGGGDLTNLERIEVLRGPAAVLYGQGSPGGTVNYVTKQPLSEPYYNVEFTSGSYDFYRPWLN